MSIALSSIILIGGMFIFFVLGVPVAFSIGLSALVYELINPLGSLLAMPQRLINGVDSFTLMAIPFFVLVGELMNMGGVTRNIFSFADGLVGHKKGGLARVNVVASMIFAGMSGSAVADASGLGAVEMKAMQENGYSKEFSAAVTAASSTIGPIFPPSITFVIYGSVTSVSIGRLLLGGAVPALMLGGLFLLYISFLAKFGKLPQPAHGKIPLRDVFKDLKNTAPALLTPIILIGGIIFGFFTPTEASAIACLYSLILGLFVYKELTLKDIAKAFVRAALTTAQIMFIISTAAYLGLILAKAQIPQIVFSSFINLFEASNKFIVLLILNVLLLIIGTVIDTNPMLIIICPILAPIAAELGIDATHFGVIIVFNLMIALLTPPVGMVTYTTCRVAQCPMDTYTKALLPWLGVLIVGLILVNVFPFLSTFVPNLFLGAM
ncbi:MAG: TRAP transporter large permease [Sphaerochaetaceae bacterium]|jgi:tripartite ATP-independent transporter DctM subunit|nr:TRAP transporter large permease [Sphaerochaetaceae bacterium]MDX9809873.1 TRAP transporter large permease [Sphaerochaetaceae bacterium]